MTTPSRPLSSYTVYSTYTTPDTPPTSVPKTNPQKDPQKQRKQIIERVTSYLKNDDKVIDEQTLLKLKEVLGEKKEIERGEIRSILSKLKEILERNVEEEPIFEEVSIIEETSTTEEVSIIEVEASTTEKVSIIEAPAIEENHDAEQVEVVNRGVAIPDNTDAVVNVNRLDNIFDDEMLRRQNDSDEHQKNLDDNVIISKCADVNNVSDVSDSKDLLQHSNYNLTEEFDDTLYKDKYDVEDDNIDNCEVISDGDKHQNYLNDVVISDNAVKIATDLNDANDTNDTKILLNIPTKNYLYNYYNVAEEFVDEIDNLYSAEPLYSTTY
ncbi:16731_t:CDS:2, partial [Rhizophagus irregularis]